jgi:hypothetical protein
MSNQKTFFGLANNLNDFIIKTKELAMEYMSKNPSRWDVIHNIQPNDKFVYTHNKEVKKLMDEIDNYLGYRQSGAGVAMVMEHIKANAPSPSMNEDAIRIPEVALE